MKKLLWIIVFVSAFALTGVVAGGAWLMHEIGKPNTVQEDTDILIASGSSGHSIAQQLQQQGLLTHPQIFYGMIRLNNTTIHAGEYAIPARASMRDILGIFQANKTIQRQFTLAEGLTVKQVVRLLEANEYLSGAINTMPKEGTLLPETYSFIRGETRQALIARMQDAHNKLLDELWAAREDGLPIGTKDDAVTLASIVEKETGIGDERARIAGLFYNRLSIGMPLQTDPTVVYAITDRLGHMEGKPLFRKHLQVDSPYNTYKIVGLPPGPIANPGRAALEAVMHPEHHDYLFFVADGTGGHVFSKNLSGHNRNVQEWRKIKRSRN